jgi:hypothetical protein
VVILGVIFKIMKLGIIEIVVRVILVAEYLMCWREIIQMKVAQDENSILVSCPVCIA